MDPIRLNRLRFRAWRRGFREADLLLGSFADAHACSFTLAELEAFEILLDQPDHDLFAWVLGTAPVPAVFEGEMMRRLRVWRPSRTS